MPTISFIRRSGFKVYAVKYQDVLKAKAVEFYNKAKEQGAQLPKPAKPLFYLIYHGESARAAQWQLLHELRANNIAADMDLSNRSVKAQFKLSDREEATHSLILGDSELANQTITLKDLKTGQQSTIPRSDLLRVLSDLSG